MSLAALSDAYPAEIATPSSTNYRPDEFDPFVAPAVTTAIAVCRAQGCVAVRGRVIDHEGARWVGGPVAEVTLDDGTGRLVLAFFGRRRIPGVGLGDDLVAGGTVVLHRERLMILNPYYWISLLAAQLATVRS